MPTPQNQQNYCWGRQDAHPTKPTKFLWGRQDAHPTKPTKFLGQARCPPHKANKILGAGKMPTPQSQQNSCGAGILPTPQSQQNSCGVGVPPAKMSTPQNQQNYCGVGVPPATISNETQAIYSDISNFFDCHWFQLKSSRCYIAKNTCRWAE
ncbi:hypothetical protein [Microseira wollei]|uniref:hypothetical protein n=1 Tax=Microseira wollei TaxID=467598 RepID=UPI001CFCE2F4|nr:hypothetical protein [Microseira wollei]